MRTRGLLIAVLLFSLTSLAAAQESARRNVVVTLTDGGFVAFKSETAWASGAGVGNSSKTPLIPQGEFRAEAFVDENRVIHRMLADAAGNYVFGYDVLIEAVPASRTFTIAVGPLDSQVENKLLSAAFPLTSIATLPQSAEPQILDDGDSFALDLLVNQKTGVKIVDLVKVSFDRSNLWDDNPRTLPRDFTLDAVPLRVIDFRLLVDGNLVAAGKPGTKFSGALIWCYVEGAGRFIFSLVPREGFQFQKVGIVADNRIEFTLKGKHYEWLSSEPILPSSGSWNLWMLHDPTYSPFGTQEVSKQEKGRLEKLDDSIKALEKKAARMREPAPHTFQKQAEVEKNDAAVPSPMRFRVMVGAADRIENLLPK
ncbi:MAG TPA: hypothetical protein VGO68_18360 [Pyrinomonadaceae bacterium]|jgi:hypothetical protein|nr:hypothetical protein [Pyrinomonadaceae bacterium]